jgi:hypothetical protein
LADYGTTSDPSDFLNTGVQGPEDAFNESYDENTNHYLTSVDLLQLEAIGLKARDPSTPHLKFNLTFDASVSAAPAGFKDAVEAVAEYYEGRILDPVTINLTISYGALGPNVLGQSQTSVDSFSYDQIRAALASDETTASDVAAALPATDPISGAHTYVLDTAQQKALGLLDGGNPASDGTVTFSNAPNAFDFNGGDGITAGLNDFAGTVANEFSEIMGRTMDVGTTDGSFTNSYQILDLYHYSSNGVRDLTTAPGYFSIDGGATNLNNFNSGAGDAADWNPATAGNDSFDNNSPSGVVNPVTAVDLQELDVLGWDVLSAVSSAAELSADIQKIDLASQASGGDGTNYVITLKAGATLTEAVDLSAINLSGNDTLTIDGQGATLDGALAHRGLFIYSGHVTVENLTIANAVARGGNGADGGGGGGAGLGGGLFVASDTAHGAAPSQVTLNNVVFQNDAAIGGNGGLTSDGVSNVGGGGGGGLGGDGAAAGPNGAGVNFKAGGQGGGGGGGVGEGGLGAGAAGGQGGDSETSTSHALPGGGGGAGANGLIPSSPILGLFGFSDRRLSGGAAAGGFLFERRRSAGKWRGVAHLLAHRNQRRPCRPGDLADQWPDAHARG